MDLSLWDEVHRFSLIQAAFLWYELLPPPLENLCSNEFVAPQQVQTIATELYSALANGDLGFYSLAAPNMIIHYAPIALNDLHKTEAIHAVAKPLLPRIELKQWALAHGRRPRFLFRDERVAVEKSSDRTWRNEALQAVGASFQQPFLPISQLAQLGGLARHRNLQNAKAMAEGIASDAWLEEQERGSRITKVGPVAANIHRAIQADLNALGLKKAPTVQTIAKWISPFAPPEAKTPGRPKNIT